MAVKNLLTVLISCLMIFSGNQSLYANDVKEEKPIVLRTMGSLFFGGSVTTLENGETFHGDHGYAQFFIPEKAHDYPLIMWHGIGQSGRSYETTPDGREGFMAIMPRRNWATYIIDQPRRGRAGRTMETEIVNAVPTTSRESSVWNAFRLGIWDAPKAPIFYKVLQFPKESKRAVEQLFRSQTPDTGAEPRNNEYYTFMGKTMESLIEKTGPAILITHSASGKYGWFSGIANSDTIKAIIAFEPGQIVLPHDEQVTNPPAGVEAAGKNMLPLRVSEEDFMKLTKMPIFIIYGDNIATEPSHIFNENIWRISHIRSKQLAEALNKRGGDVRVIHLPEIGIKGNTHAAFADLNNLEIADLVEKLLHEKNLDTANNPHTGPKMGELKEYTIPLK